MADLPAVGPDPLTERLRRAGCVFAEDEAAVLRASARTPAQLEALLSRRISGEPLEQVVGWVQFGTLRLRVRPGVFVPRQRTLLLAGRAVRCVAKSGGGPFVEAFSGVAPVAASVRDAFPNVEIHLTDIDPTALRCARTNVAGLAGVHAGSVLTGLPAELVGRVAVIAAVPPYVPTADRALLPREARDYERPAALFGGDDGLGPARALIGQAARWLRPGGRVLVELNRRQLADARRCAQQAGFESRTHRGADGQTAILEAAAPG